MLAQQQQQYRGEKRQIFAARTMGETIAYLGDGATNNKDIVVITNNWASAYYFKAFALIELGRVEEAKNALNQALKLSPQNNVYLAEQASYYQREKNWSESNKIYKLAEDTNALAPENTKDVELASIWRNMGFNFIELNQLDEAKEIFLKALKINPNDQRSKQELQYIEELKSKGQTRPAAVSAVFLEGSPQK